MDALALLCTLHADGPTSLKRLRGRGCADIQTLVVRNVDDVAEDLAVERSVARRLLREARLLVDRIGPDELDAEEVPPASRKPRRVDPLEPPVDLPAPRTVQLDAADRALVARLSRLESGPGVGSGGDPVAGSEDVAPFGASVFDERIHAPAPDRVPAPAPAPGPAPAPAPAGDPAPAVGSGMGRGADSSTSELAPERLPGLDAGLVEDLKEMGIDTLQGLSRAESLQLTRHLGISFAQSRRLRFLARRAAESVEDEGVRDPAPPSTPTSSAVAPAPLLGVPAEPPGDLPADSSAALPAATASRAEVEATAPDTRPSDPLEEPQGVRVDPADIEARPRFGDQFARAAAQRAASTGTPGRTVLGWNFEVPRPEDESFPAPAPPSEVPRNVRDAEGPSVQQSLAASNADDDTAGPFARS